MMDGKTPKEWQAHEIRVAGTPIGKLFVERYEIAEQITDIQDGAFHGRVEGREMTTVRQHPVLIPPAAYYTRTWVGTWWIKLGPLGVGQPMMADLIVMEGLGERAHIKALAAGYTRSEVLDFTLGLATSPFAAQIF
jgi:hypothetical protein